MSCAINAQQIVGVKEGDSVLIIGGGPLGAIHVEVAKASGAAQVMIVELTEPRLSMLRRFKDLVVIDGSQEDVGAVVKQHTADLGADVVIVAAPAARPMEEAINYVCKGGAVSLFASLPSGKSDITLDSRIIHYGELRVCGASDSRPEHVELAVKLLAEGKIDHEAIVTHWVPLERILDGVQLMKETQSLNVLVYPPGQEPQ